jgi:predicted MFS family arabinose efflux permease
LIFCYLAMTASLFILASSTVLWHFWLSTALQWIVVASIGIGSALVTDIVPQEAISAGLALFGATNFIGLVVGTATTGAAIQNLGMAPTLVIGALLALVGAGMAAMIRRFASESVRTYRESV